MKNRTNEEDFNCDGCGTSWSYVSPMLKDEVWLTIARKDDLLCVFCMIKRILLHFNRLMSPDDLTSCPANKEFEIGMWLGIGWATGRLPAVK